MQVLQTVSRILSCINTRLLIWKLKMSYTITFVRHGETDFNVNNLMHSYSNGGIHQMGVKQAEALGTLLANEKYTRAYSSDMERTQETAKAIFSKSNLAFPDLVLDQRLRERSFGEWEGRPNKEFMSAVTKSGLNVLFEMMPPGGETHQQTTDRVIEFFEELCSTCDNSAEDENVLIVTHGLWVLSFLLYLKDNKTFELVGLDGSLFSVANLRGAGGPTNTSKTTLKIHRVNNNLKDGKRKIEISCVMDSSHLKDLKCN